MALGRTPSTDRQMRRLVEEMEESGLVLDGSKAWHHLLVEELDYARRPMVHERRVPSFGAIIAPTVSAWAWEETTELSIERRAIGDHPVAVARRFADGVSSWVIRYANGADEWAVFDRPAGSERDLVVLADALGAVIVQRHPSGQVRLVGEFGVYRWDGLNWHHEPHVAGWIEAIVRDRDDDRDVLETLLEFAVHDLGARNVGATLIYRPDPDSPGTYQKRLGTPPPLNVLRAPDLAPLRHVLGQIDGAALFDDHGVLSEIGVRLVPSPDTERKVEGFRGMRHTSARRYSVDDPQATVIVVSEDGPVTVLRDGKRLGASAPIPHDQVTIVDPDPPDLEASGRDKSSS